MNLHDARRDSSSREVDKLIAGSDPGTFQLQIEFLHAHGHPRGKLTTLSHTFTLTDSTDESAEWTGAPGK